MSKVAAFGIPVFLKGGRSKTPPVIVQEINQKLEQLNIDADAVISIVPETEFFHVFYKA